jgi:hypothetical protein
MTNPILAPNDNDVIVAGILSEMRGIDARCLEELDRTSKYLC